MREKFSEIISSETKKEIQLITEIDKLFNQLKDKSKEEEEKVTIKKEIRDKLKRYRQLFGNEAKDTINQYYKRLEELEE